jgi:DNA-binding transcriptional LysR family regulator
MRRAGPAVDPASSPRAVQNCTGAPAGELLYDAGVARAGDLDWNDLRYFLAAARAKTLAGAARALGVEHSTIGRRLGALEESLGVALLTRAPGGVELTAIGEAIAPLVEAMERAARDIAEAVASRAPRVRLATPSGFSRFIAPHLAGFQAAHPGVTLELLSSSRTVDLRRGEADLALRTLLTDDEDLMVRKLAEIGWSLYAADCYLARRPAPADPRALAGHEVLGFEASLSGAPGARWLAEHGAGAVVVMRCRELTDMVAACVAGLGLAVLPGMAAALEPSLRRLTGEVLGTRPLYLVYRKEVLVSPAIAAVADFVTDLFRRQADALAGGG